MRPRPGSESVIRADNHGESFATLQRPGERNATEIREMAGYAWAKEEKGTQLVLRV